MSYIAPLPLVVISSLAVSLLGCGASPGSRPGDDEGVDAGAPGTEPDAGARVDDPDAGVDAGAPAPPRTPYGINVHLPGGAAVAPLFDKVVDAGIQWVRLDFDWYVAEPRQDQFNWAPYDAAVAAAAARGLLIYATLGYAPAWANGNRPAKVPAINPADWADFCRQVARRYDGDHGQPRIDHFGMWNEPDHGGRKFFGEDDDSDDEVLDKYVELVLEPGAAAIRAERADARVAAPDLAHRPEFLIDLLARAKDSIDVITVHRYGDTAAEVTDYFDGPYWPWEDPNIADILADEELTGAKEVWLTETGWATTWPHPCWFDPVSESTQATRQAELLAALATRPWINKVFVYELIDADLTNACQWGLLRSDRSEKPAFAAYRDYIAAHPAGL